MHTLSRWVYPAQRRGGPALLGNTILRIYIAITTKPFSEDALDCGWVHSLDNGCSAVFGALFRLVEAALRRPGRTFDSCFERSASSLSGRHNRCVLVDRPHRGSIQSIRTGLLYPSGTGHF